MQTSWCRSSLFKKSILTYIYYNRAYFILHFIITLEIWSLGISNFLEEISSFPHSIVFPFLCTVHLRSLSYLSLLFLGTLSSVGSIFPFLPCFWLLFLSRLSDGPTTKEILLSSVMQAIVKDWVRSTHRTPGLTWSWQTSGTVRCSSHTSRSAGQCLPRWRRGPPRGWRCSDGCRPAHSRRRTCTWATRRASGSRSGSPTCPPAAKRQRHTCAFLHHRLLEGGALPQKRHGRRSPPSSGLFRYLPQHTHLLFAKRDGDKEESSPRALDSPQTE